MLQFGFEIMFIPPFSFLQPSMAKEFTSGTIRGTFSTILNADELSITKVPVFPAFGANCFAIEPPALNKAKSTLDEI